MLMVLAYGVTCFIRTSSNVSPRRSRFGRSEVAFEKVPDLATYDVLFSV